MFKILIDTCVWLDLAKDNQGQGVLGVLETLVRQKQVSIILPRTVLDEFTRNKARVAGEGSRSLSTVLKRAKEVVHRLGDAKNKQIVLDQLNDVDYKLPSLGESAIEAIGRIEKLFSSTTVVETSDEVKLRAAHRAIDRRAPFHPPCNGIDDAILIETYADLAKNRMAGDQCLAKTSYSCKMNDLAKALMRNFPIRFLP
jgi:hypothetical protein